MAAVPGTGACEYYIIDYCILYGIDTTTTSLHKPRGHEPSDKCIL